ncbi:MAG: carbohydrate kinase family protein [Devosiaceae bacterium]
MFAGLDGEPAMGREVFADSLTICPGGGAFITAAYLAALGEDVALVGTLPAAPFENVVVNDMSAGGIGNHCASADSHEPQITAAVVGKTDRAFITRRIGDAVPPAIIDALPNARHLHIGELTTALEQPELITAAHARGMSVSLDCAWDEMALRHDDVADIIARVDVFLPNADEMEHLARHRTALQPKAALVVKKGAQGATCTSSNGQKTHADAQASDVVDTTGAGDAFNAGFLSAWLAGRGPREALQLGHACGRQAVSRLGGARDLPDLRSLVTQDRAAS